MLDSFFVWNFEPFFIPCAHQLYQIIIVIQVMHCSNHSMNTPVEGGGLKNHIPILLSKRHGFTHSPQIGSKFGLYSPAFFEFPAFKYFWKTASFPKKGESPLERGRDSKSAHSPAMSGSRGNRSPQSGGTDKFPLHDQIHQKRLWIRPYIPPAPYSPWFFAIPSVGYSYYVLICIQGS